MISLLKKLRGALGTAITWSVSWVLGALGLGLVMFVVSPGLDLGMFADVYPIFALLGATTGFLGGCVFSAVLGTVHRRRQLHDLSAMRMALWGGLAGALVPLGFLGFWMANGALAATLPLLASTATAFGGAGAATAFGTVRLAQAAARAELGTGPYRSLLGSSE